MSEEIIMTIFEACVSVFEYCVFVWLYRLVSDGVRSRYEKTEVVSTGMLYLAAMYLCDMNKVMPTVKLVLLTVLVCTGMYLIYNIRVTKLLTVTVYNLLVTIVSETIVMGTVLGLYWHQADVQACLNQSAIRVQSVLMAKVIYILFLILLKSFLLNTKKGYSRKELFLLVIQTISSAFVIAMAIELTVSFELKSSVSPYIFSGVSFCAFAAYCVCIWITDDYINNQNRIQEKIRLEEYRKQKEQYLSIRHDAEQGVRQIYHDLKCHMKAIDKLQQVNSEELDRYIGDINSILKPYEKFYNTGCEILDMILTEKQSVVEQAGIQFDAKIEEQSLAGLQTFHLNVIFTNALDNAFEANQCEAENRFISIRVKKEREGVSILVRNSYHTPLRHESGGLFGTSKQDKEKHGIGLGSVCSSVESLGGRINAEGRDGIFSLFILI